MDREMRVRAAHLRTAAVGDRGERPFDQQVSTPVEAKVLKVDTRQP
jgi:hypothetical protein